MENPVIFLDTSKSSCYPLSMRNIVPHLYSFPWFPPKTPKYRAALANVLLHCPQREKKENGRIRGMLVSLDLLPALWDFCSRREQVVCMKWDQWRWS